MVSKSNEFFIKFVVLDYWRIQRSNIYINKLCPFLAAFS